LKIWQAPFVQETPRQLSALLRNGGFLLAWRARAYEVLFSVLHELFELALSVLARFGIQVKANDR
jgi:hypothetical protein